LCKQEMFHQLTRRFIDFRVANHRLEQLLTGYRYVSKLKLKAKCRYKKKSLPIGGWIPTQGHVADLPLALVLRPGSVSCGFWVRVWLYPFPLCRSAQRLNPSQLWDQVSADIALIYVAT